MIEFSVSRQSLHDLMSRQGVGLGAPKCAHETARGAHTVACSVNTIAHNDRALCMRQTCNSALCCALFGPLYMDIVHEHCSWALLKKKYKNNPRELGHRITY